MGLLIWTWLWQGPRYRELRRPQGGHPCCRAIERHPLPHYLRRMRFPNDTAFHLRMAALLIASLFLE
ncbi:MAG TPA: hypothetical protein VFD82_21190, partial [Planctomycetota bacterium]|nr:hypothetical protein [Planctomycetota bacterium]